MIPLAECVEGRVYRLHSRNLDLGVFVSADRGFIGIREKFGSRYLFTEYHHDTGPPYGTATPLEDIGEVPENINLVERHGSIDQVTKRPVAFDKPIRGGGRGWYFVDTDEASEDIRPISVHNDKLFGFLESLS